MAIFFLTAFFEDFFLALVEDLREGLRFRVDGFLRLVDFFFFVEDFFDFLEVFFFLTLEAFATLFSRSGKSWILGVSGSRTPPLTDRYYPTQRRSRCRPYKALEAEKGLLHPLRSGKGEHAELASDLP